MKISLITIALLTATACTSKSNTASVASAGSSAKGSATLSQYFDPPTIRRVMAEMPCLAPSGNEITCIEAKPVDSNSDEPSVGENRNARYGVVYNKSARQVTVKQYFDAPSIPKDIATIKCGAPDSEKEVSCIQDRPSSVGAPIPTIGDHKNGRFGVVLKLK